MVQVLSWRSARNLTPKQCEALDFCVGTPNALCLYGGAGYGGKSYLLRQAGPYFNGRLRHMGFPGQTGVLFCSTYGALKDRHFGKFMEELGHLGRIVEDHIYGLCFRFNEPSMGRIALRNLDQPDKYRSAEFAWALFDELTEITADKFFTAIYSIRSPKSLPFMPILCGSNPDGIGHIWVKTLWVPQYQDLNEFPDMEPSRLKFVQALPHDNPTYATNQQIKATFAQLPDHIRIARTTGSWDAPEGARWPVLNKYVHLFSIRERFPYGLPAGWPVIMGVDYGLRAPYCALWIAVDGDKNLWVFREDYQTGFTAEQQAQRMLMLTGRNEQVQSVYYDPACEQVFPQHKGKSDDSVLKDYKAKLEPDERFGPLVAGYNESRMLAMNTLDRFFDHDNEYPNIYIEEGCKNLWRELTGAVWDTRGMLSGKREDIDPRNPDHAITALYYAAHTNYYGPAKAPAPLPTPQEARELMHKELIEKDAKDFGKRARKLQF